MTPLSSILCNLTERDQDNWSLSYLAPENGGRQLQPRRVAATTNFTSRTGRCVARDGISAGCRAMAATPVPHAPSPQRGFRSPDLAGVGAWIQPVLLQPDLAAHRNHHSTASAWNRDSDPVREPQLVQAAPLASTRQALAQPRLSEHPAGERANGMQNIDCDDEADIRASTKCDEEEDPLALLTPASGGEELSYELITEEALRLSEWQKSGGDALNNMRDPWSMGNP